MHPYEIVRASEDYQAGRLTVASYMVYLDAAQRAYTPRRRAVSIFGCVRYLSPYWGDLGSGLRPPAPARNPALFDVPTILVEAATTTKAKAEGCHDCDQAYGYMVLIPYTEKDGTEGWEPTPSCRRCLPSAEDWPTMRLRDSVMLVHCN